MSEGKYTYWGTGLRNEIEQFDADDFEERLRRMVEKAHKGVDERRIENMLSEGIFWVDAYGLIAQTLHVIYAKFENERFQALPGEKLKYYTNDRWGLGWRDKKLSEVLGRNTKEMTVQDRAAEWKKYMDSKYPGEPEASEAQRVVTTTVARIINGPLCRPTNLLLGETVYLALGRSK